MDGVTSKVKGLRDLEKSLEQFEKLATRRTVGRNSLKSGGQLIVDHASRLAPDDPKTTTQDLRNEIVVGTRLTTKQRRENRKEARQGKGSDIEVFVGPNEQVSAYAHLQEFGTKHHAAHPFMRPAWDAQKMLVLSTIGKHLKLNIEKTAIRLAKRVAK